MAGFALVSHLDKEIAVSSNQSIIKVPIGSISLVNRGATGSKIINTKEKNNRSYKRTMTKSEIVEKYREGLIGAVNKMLDTLYDEDEKTLRRQSMRNCAEP